MDKDFFNRILPTESLFRLLDFGLFETSAKIEKLLCWACAVCYYDTISNPGQIAVRLIQQTQLRHWFINKRMLTQEKLVWRICWSRSSGCGHFKDFRQQSLLFSFSTKNCLVPRRLKCGKRKTRLHEPSRSIAQWTMGTFNVDAKDAGKGKEKFETPHRFGAISVQRTPISGYGLWTVLLALFWGERMSRSML